MDELDGDSRAGTAPGNLQPGVEAGQALTALDDHFVHRGPFPASKTDDATSRDPRFFERHWNVWHDDVGDLLVATGGSWYPNLGRVETYAIVNFRGEHRSVRAMRPAHETGEKLPAGPIRPAVIEGLRRWHHTVQPGPWDFSFDLTWTDSHRQVYGASWGPAVDAGERQVTAGFEGFGQVTGWIQVGRARIEWPPGRAHGTRDRHWGVGRGAGGPQLNGSRRHRAGWKGGIWIDLGDVGLWGKRLLYPIGDPRPGAGTVQAIDRQLRFEPETEIFTAGVIDLVLGDGSRRRLRLTRLGNQTAYMKCGFYGGTPGSDLHHGEYNGPERTEWDSFDVNDPAVRRQLRGLDEHHCLVEPDIGPATTGILQPLEPDVYLACAERRPGWRLWEPGS